MSAPAAAPIAIEVQIACARRELALRKRVYPGWVNAKRMTQFKAEDEIAAMAAILLTLEGIAAGKARVP